ncbi:beta-mannosidase [Pseudonocardia sp. MH-G8]|nr:beta-mannosidase [Pseudonocardia sp. MH-G8]
MTMPDTPWLGVNYWSRAGGPRMWVDYDAETVAEELDTLVAHGLTTTRSFFFWPDFMPEPGRIDEAKVAAFTRFLDQHAERGIGTIPTFLVGHMSGENWDPSWRGGRDLYTDVWMVGRQSWFVREMVERLGAHQAIVGWLVSNEMPIYGRPETRGGPEDREAVSAWAELMITAVRAGGATQPVSLGDGAWGIEVTGADNGFHVRDIAPLVDFLGPHVYRMEDDQSRQFLTAAFICHLLDFAGRPVVLEEFGVTSAYVSDANAAHYYRQVLHSSLLAGARGWLAWNNTDYGHIADQDPYRHHAFELYFGLTDSDGRPKPALREVREFSRVLEAVDVGALRRPASDAALVVSSYLAQRHPLTPAADGPFVFRALRQAWIAAWAADLPLDLVRERDGITEGHRLYLVPSTKALLAPTWTRLEELAAGGATVYVSYCAGEHSWQRGPWWAEMNRIFGVEHQLRYGLVEPVEGEVELTVARAFGGLAAGERLTFTAAGTENSRSYLPVRPTDAEVLLADAQGRPALLRRRVGEGWMVLGTYPVEHFAAMTPGVNPEDTTRIYGALAAEAGVRTAASVADPLVHVEALVHPDGRRFLWVLSQHEDAVTAHVEITAGLVDAVTGEPVEPGRVPLDPFGVRVLQMTGEN